MLWNELSYNDQLKVLNLIEDLLLRQSDEEMQDGLVAALNELEIWSHAPCGGSLTSIEEPYVAQAQLAELESEWDRIAESIAGKKFSN